MRCVFFQETKLDWRFWLYFKDCSESGNFVLKFEGTILKQPFVFVHWASFGELPFLIPYASGRAFNYRTASWPQGMTHPRPMVYFSGILIWNRNTDIQMMGAKIYNGLQIWVIWILVFWGWVWLFYEFCQLCFISF